MVLPGDPPGGGGRGPGGGGGKRQRGAASAPGAGASAPAAGASAPVTAAAEGPTPEQRKRMLDQVKDDPEALERRQRFLAAIDAGDPAALERWRSMREKRQGGGSRSEK